MNIFSKIFYIIFKFFLSIYVFIFQNVRYKKNGIKLPKGQVLFISNHHTDWDPIYLNCMFPRRMIPGLMHDEAFKGILRNFLFKKVFRCVKRGSSKSDITAVKEMIKIRNSGRDLVIYPEGDIDFFGRNLPVEISIAKLVKKLNMPMALLSLTGAHLRAPRWSKYPHHSKIVYSLNRVLSSEEIKQLSNEELYKIILDNIKVDEMAYQKKTKIVQLATNRAESLELGLFMCPKCYSINSMVSKNNDFVCSKCEFKTHYNKYSFFKYTKNYQGVKYLQTTCDWDDFQMKELRKLIDNNDGKTPIIEENNLIWGNTQLGLFFEKLDGNASLRLFKNHLEMNCDEKIIEFQIKDIYRMFVQYKSTLEVIVGTERYRFCHKNKMFCAYLWMKTFEILNEKKTDIE